MLNLFSIQKLKDWQKWEFLSFIYKQDELAYGWNQLTTFSYLAQPRNLKSASIRKGQLVVWEGYEAAAYINSYYIKHNLKRNTLYYIYNPSKCDLITNAGKHTWDSSPSLTLFSSSTNSTVLQIGKFFSIYIFRSQTFIPIHGGSSKRLYIGYI